jgi:hypothetical protein
VDWSTAALGRLLYDGVVQYQRIGGSADKIVQLLYVR